MSVLLSAAITVIITAVSMLLTEPVLAVMQTPENIMQDACGYMYVIFGGTAATLFFNLVSSVLRALGDSKTPLYILVVASILNVLLDLLFVLKYNMGGYWNSLRNCYRASHFLHFMRDIHHLQAADSPPEEIGF